MTACIVDFYLDQSSMGGSVKQQRQQHHHVKIKCTDSASLLCLSASQQLITIHDKQNGHCLSVILTKPIEKSTQITQISHVTMAREIQSFINNKSRKNQRLDTLTMFFNVFDFFFGDEI